MVIGKSVICQFQRSTSLSWCSPHACC